MSERGSSSGRGNPVERAMEFSPRRGVSIGPHVENDCCCWVVLGCAGRVVAWCCHLCLFFVSTCSPVGGSPKVAYLGLSGWGCGGDQFAKVVCVWTACFAICPYLLSPFVAAVLGVGWLRRVRGRGGEYCVRPLHRGGREGREERQPGPSNGAITSVLDIESSYLQTPSSSPAPIASYVKCYITSLRFSGSR